MVVRFLSALDEIFRSSVEPKSAEKSKTRSLVEVSIYVNESQSVFVV